MENGKTHFEQVPVKVVKKMIEAQRIKYEFHEVPQPADKIPPARREK